MGPKNGMMTQESSPISWKTPTRKVSKLLTATKATSVKKDQEIWASCVVNCQISTGLASIQTWAYDHCHRSRRRAPRYQLSLANEARSRELTSRKVLVKVAPSCQLKQPSFRNQTYKQRQITTLIWKQLPCSHWNHQSQWWFKKISITTVASILRVIASHSTRSRTSKSQYLLTRSCFLAEALWPSQVASTSMDFRASTSDF